MNAIQVSSMALAIVSSLALAPAAAAQDRVPALLNALEVRQLVARAEPATHARLAAHFTALAARYAAEAGRHASMSHSFGGNPRRSFGAGMSAHCNRLADLNMQSATIVRELAAYHDKLASGAPATPPRDGEGFHSGAGAPEPTEKELNALAAKASTPAEHRALEEYFLTLARRHTADATEHSALANTYRGTRITLALAHHNRLAELAREAAKEANDAAAMHKSLGAVGR